MRDAVPADQMLVSMDVGEHGVISVCPALAGRSPLSALELLVDEGVTEVILLALPPGGDGRRGRTSRRCAPRAPPFPAVRLIAGGGVRTAADLRALAAAGADGVLLATALHRGWITAADIHAARSGGRPLTSGP